MLDRSHFYFKASSEPFDFDFKRYSAKHIHRTPRSVFLSNDDSIVVQRSEDWLEIRVGTPSLGHAKIRWHEPTSRLEVQLDRFGLQSIFYHETAKVVYLSSRIDILALTLPSPELCPKAVAFYLMAGFLPPGWTFWQKIRRIASRSRWDFLKPEVVHESNRDWEPMASRRTVSPTEMVEIIRESLRLIRTEVAPTQMRLSGGVDTRVVSYLWDSPIEAVVVKSPWMKEGTDLDVNIAAKWASLRGIPLRVSNPDASSFAFLGEPSAKPMLTGLCGGEFLGGQFSREIPSQVADWDSILKENFSEEFREILEDDEWIRSVRSDSAKWQNEAARVYLQSTRSTIYRSFVGSWAIPHELHIEAVSPFTTPIFLDTFLSSIGSWGDYEFYEEVFRALGSTVMDVPLSSLLTRRIPEMVPGPEWGIEPKGARPLGKPEPLSAESIVEWSTVLRRNGIPISPDEAEHLLTRSPLRLNARTLYGWLKVRRMLGTDILKSN